MVSAGLVHNPSSEASLGTTNDKLLGDAATLTHGQTLKPGAKLELAASQAMQFIELWPLLVTALLLLFMLDVAVRRWEHVVGIWQSLVRK